VSIFQILAESHFFQYSPLARVAVSHTLAAVLAVAAWAVLARLWLHGFFSIASISKLAAQHNAITRPTAVTTAANVSANVIG
jgi:RNA:NAD 2'-phosphotransferase (TPT1/KptA family)